MAKRLALNVKSLRDSMGLDQVGFAKKLGVHWQTVLRWEKGHTDPSPMALRRLREMQQPEVPARRDSNGNSDSDSHQTAAMDSDTPTSPSFGVVPARRVETMT